MALFEEKQTQLKKRIEATVKLSPQFMFVFWVSLDVENAGSLANKNGYPVCNFP